MLVSVIIPVYNAEKWIGDTLYSVFKQTWKHIEIIVVNDGSIDSSSAIINQVSDSFSGTINLIEQDNRGACAARNVGLRQAKGTFIQFLDADDILAPNKIEIQMALLQNSAPNSVAFCSWAHFTDQPSDAIYKKSDLDKDYEFSIDWLVDSWSGKGMAIPACWLAPRALLDQVGPWDELLVINQDGEYFCRVLLKAHQLKYSPETIVYYRKPQQKNVSQQKSVRALQSLLNSYVSYEKNILKTEDSLRVRAALARNYINLLYQMGHNHSSIEKLVWKQLMRLNCPMPKKVGGKKFTFLIQIVGTKLALRIRSCAIKVYYFFKGKTAR